MLTTIRQIGIFMICAQSILFLLPEEQYGKYVKVLVGIMILMQFLLPIRSLLTGESVALLQDQTAVFQMELQQIDQEKEIGDENLGIYDGIEDEIKDRIYVCVTEAGYRVEQVELKLENQEGQNKQAGEVVVVLQEKEGCQGLDGLQERISETINVSKESIRLLLD